MSVHDDVLFGLRFQDVVNEGINVGSMSSKRIISNQISPFFFLYSSRFKDLLLFTTGLTSGIEL